MLYDIALFDLDGTLTDSQPGITKSVQYVLSTYGIEVRELKTLTKFVGPPLQESFREFYAFTAEQAEQAFERFLEYYPEHGIFDSALYPGITELLQNLKFAGLTLAIATSKQTVNALRIAEHFELSRYFAVIAGAERDGVREQKSEVIAFALQQLDPERKLRAVMIGDRKHDILGAHEAGIDSVGVTWGYGAREELEAAGATFIVNSSAELAALLI